VHGGGQASQNLITLAGALRDSFTVYVPDRRGRGIAGRPAFPGKVRPHMDSAHVGGGRGLVCS
jgi:hypothetical protein